MNLNDPVAIPKDPATFLGDEQADDAGKQTNTTEAAEAQNCTSAAQPNAEQDSVADGGFDQQRTETATQQETRSPQRSALISEPRVTLSNNDQHDMEIKRNEVESDATSKYTSDSTHRPFAYSSADEILAKYLGKSNVIDTAANYPIFSSSRYSTLLGTTTAPSYVDAKFPVAVTTSTYAHPIGESESTSLPSSTNRDSNLHAESDALKLVDVEKERTESSKASPSLRLHTMSMETTKLLARLNEVSMRPKLTGLCDARVADWLRSLELANVERYIRLFAEHEVDFYSLQLLSVSDLREMGINAIGPLNKIAYAIRELRRIAPVVFKPGTANSKVPNGNPAVPKAANGAPITAKSVSGGAAAPKKKADGSSDVASSRSAKVDAPQQKPQSAQVANVTKVHLADAENLASAAASGPAYAAAARTRVVSVATPTDGGGTTQPHTTARKELKLDLRKLDNPQSARTSDSARTRRAESTEKTADSKVAHAGRHVNAPKEQPKKQKPADVARRQSAATKLEPRASTQRAPSSSKRSLAASSSAREDSRGRSARERLVAPRSRSVATARHSDEVRSRLTGQPLANELRMLERQVAELYTNTTGVASSRQRSKSGGDADDKKFSEQGAKLQEPSTSTTASTEIPAAAAPAAPAARHSARSLERAQPPSEHVSFSAGTSPTRRPGTSDRLASLAEMHALVERLQKQLSTVQNRLGVAHPSASSRSSRKEKEAAPSSSKTEESAQSSAPNKSRPSTAVSARRGAPKPNSNVKSENGPKAAPTTTPRVTKSENASRGGVELCVVESLSPTKMRFADESVRLFAHRLVGEGAFTRVYRGTFQQRSVVLKCLKRKPTTARDQAYFAEECSKLRQLTTVGANLESAVVDAAHPNVASVLGYVEFLDSAPRSARERTFAFVQTLAEGGSLYEFIHSRSSDRPLTHILYYRIARDVATGMNWLHAHAPEPVLHLNLTSRNVLLDAHLRARVADFGFNRLRHAAPLFNASELQVANATRENGALRARNGVRTSLGATRGDRCLGVCSVNYLPPELLLRSGLEFELDATGSRVLSTRNGDSESLGSARGDILTTKVDVFSFGMLLFEMLTRSVPFVGRSHVQIADALYRRERPSLSGALSAADLERLISACWHQVAINRPSFTEILYRLERLALPGKWYQLVQKTASISLYALLNNTAPSRREMIVHTAGSPRRDGLSTGTPSYSFRKIVHFVGECLQHAAKVNTRITKLEDQPVTQFETLIECTDYEIDYIAAQLNAAIEKGQLADDGLLPAISATATSADERQSSLASAAIREVTSAALNASRLPAASDRD